MACRPHKGGVFVLACNVLLSLVLAQSPDKAALLQLKASFLDAASSDPALTAEVTRNFQSWTADTEPCSPVGTWQRVSCVGERVTALNLSSAGLSGSIPEAISSLNALQSLSFVANALEGSLPQALFQLTSLTELHLNLNRFSDSLPDDVSALSKLVLFQATGNQLAGSIPLALANMTSLQKLDLSGNLLSGSIPDLSPLKQLTLLSLSVNQFSGPIPSWLGQMPKLATLGLRANTLDGNFPELGGSTSLQQLFVSDNSLTGPLPDSISSLTNLVLLFASQNKLNGGIPGSISSLTALNELDLSFNLGLGGSLPSSLSSLTNLNLLGLTGCNIQESIPESLAGMRSLKGVYLDRNQLTGSIPASIGTLSGLTQLFLSQNQLTGTIPSTLCSLQELSAVDLGSNGLNGSIPSCLVSLPFLQGLVLSDNRLSGALPSGIPASLLFQYKGNCLSDALDQDSSCVVTVVPGGVAVWVWIVTAVGLLVLASLGVLGIILLCKRAKGWKPWKLSFNWSSFWATLKSWMFWSFSGAGKPTAVQKSHTLHTLPVTEFSLQEVEEATRSFTAQISKGSYGTVYLAVGLFAGQGPHNYRSLVKRATSPRVLELSESAFKDQVASLARAQHRYIVAIKGFCLERGERILVYEFMAKGTLYARLHDKNQEPLPWASRTRIAASLASALEYLHHTMKPGAVHGAVTSKNVLLTADSTPKLSDLGVATGSAAAIGSAGMARGDKASERTKRRRLRFSSSRGSPEGSPRAPAEGEEEGGGTQSELLLAQKAEVWGFGVILLELISGQEVMKDVHITTVARPFLEDPNVSQLLVDQQLGFNYEVPQLLFLVGVARSCINEEPLQRPTMRQVVQTMRSQSLVDPTVFETDALDDISLVAPGRLSKRFSIKKDILPSVQSRQRRGFDSLSLPQDVEMGVGMPPSFAGVGAETATAASAQSAQNSGLVGKLMEMAGNILLASKKGPPSPRMML